MTFKQAAAHNIHFFSLSKGIRVFFRTADDHVHCHAPETEDVFLQGGKQNTNIQKAHGEWENLSRPSESGKWRRRGARDRKDGSRG